MEIVILIVCAVVALILFRGLWNMMQGGSPSRSQKLMRLRVAAQAVAVAAMVVFVVFMQRS
jgi:hypothetical protein